MHRRSIRNKKFILYAVVLLVVAVLAVTFARRFVKLIWKPVKGDERAAIYNAKPIADAAKMFEAGASATKLSDPANVNLVSYLRIDGTVVDAFSRQNEASFSEGGYLNGILSFRGNALRNTSAAGENHITEGKFSATWKTGVGKASGVTKNLDWRGQALVITWSSEVRQLLVRPDSKKSKENFTEIIYASKDGRIYFLDIEDGSYTREPIVLGTPVTGTGTICPDGKPIYVVGTGDCAKNDDSQIFVINLINGEIVGKFGERSNFTMKLPEEKYDFYASALFSDKGDCLVTQGENGVIYTYAVAVEGNGGDMKVKLNQKAEYTYSYDDGRSATSSSGIAAWGEYLYSCDTDGQLVCTNVNTLETVWVRKLGQCFSCTPVLEEDREAGTVFIYVGSSLDLDDGKKTKGLSYITKLNAATGDIIWQREYKTRVTKLTDGGFMGTACLGSGSLSDYIFFTAVGTTGKKADKKNGIVLAINKKTGGMKYYVRLKNYAASSPVCVYGADGAGYLIICDNEGNLFLLDGESGKVKDTRKIGERITTEPIVYNNKLIIGTESKIYGITLE
ncbi:MAG: PQQ-like beta-propeller repeat protein [Lachnospiraceae bacterium]|nr:PQQ-like beta-propeller repeat protein [Lachnospiraceae bacterium]